MFDAQQTADLEFQPAAVQQELTDRRLREHVRYLADRSPFYRRRFAEAGLEPATIRGVADLPRLPFTTKADLESHNRDFLCVADTEIVDLCLTSGTTGKPVALLQSRADLDRLGYNEEISFRATGLTNQDRVLNAAAMDRCFMAGLAYFLGLTRLGATVLRCGSSSPATLAEMVRTHRPTAIVGVPSTLLTVAKRLAADGVAPAALGVSRLICIGEPVRRPDLSLSALGEQLREHWQARIFTTYASTEMATAFTDCAAGAGGHLHPDLVALELVDDAGQPVPPGQPGEVVATPLQVTGMPLLRLKTGDRATLLAAPCACGRQSPRLGPILGRQSQMLKYRGTTVYPPAIFAVLQELEAIQGYYLEVYDDFALSDRLRVVVGVAPPAQLDPQTVAERLAAAIRVKPEVVVTTPEQIAAKTIQEGKRKPVVFFDYREHQRHD